MVELPADDGIGDMIAGLSMHTSRKGEVSFATGASLVL